MKTSVIGAGSMGSTLARHLVRLGHDVALANSRGSHTLSALAAEIGARPCSVADVAQAADLILLAIPSRAVVELAATFAKADRGAIVIDLGNYHPRLRDGRIEAIERGLLDSQWVAQQIGYPVIKAFNNIFARSLLEKGRPKDAPGRIALPVAGDSLAARAAVMGLVDDLGFDPVDEGHLSNSWRQGTGTPAYCRDLDAVALRRALGDAERSRVAEYRAEEEARIERLR